MSAPAILNSPVTVSGGVPFGHKGRCSHCGWMGDTSIPTREADKILCGKCGIGMLGKIPTEPMPILVHQEEAA